MKDLIGIMDSGVGGVSVLCTARRMLPHENFIYFGDNKNAPYGPRDIEEIRRLSREACACLLNKDIKALVIACNTITSAYAEQLRREVSIPVIGMEPAVKPASLARSDGRILALATRATLNLEKFSTLMKLYGEGVIPLEGKGLVEIVERGEADTEKARDALQALFAPYLQDKIDGIVLGCTHYPFLRRQIESFFPDAKIFDGREGTVRQLARKLAEYGCLTDNTADGKIEIESSGGEACVQLMRALFEKDI